MTHKPGREFDALVAERVMGWPKAYDAEADVWYSITADEIPRYSTDIAAAWEVVGHLTQMPGFNSIDLRIEPDCVIAEAWIYSRAKTVEGDTAPHAICLAALKAQEATP